MQPHYYSRSGTSTFASLNKCSIPIQLNPALVPQQTTPTTSLSMLMHHRASATLPRREQNATVAAIVFDVFEPADQVGDAADAEAGAED